MTLQRARASPCKGTDSLSFAIALLVTTVLLLYAPVVTFDFLALDDEDFVTANPAVLSGLTLAGVRWSLTAVTVSNWQPAAWWSHMLDVSLFGLDAGMHHLVSAALHALNAALLLVLLHRLTGTLLPSVLAASLFALHPLRVESVAWVSERKDVLSATFWLLATLAHVSWCRERSFGRRLLTIALTALGLMAKPTLVTLPFALLLLDAWPLGRAFGARRERWGQLVREKAPLFALAAVGSALAFFAQSSGGTLTTLTQSPLAARIETAIVGYGWYVSKWLWPTDLAVLRLPPAQGWPVPQLLLSTLIVFGGTLAALTAARRHPYLATGWLWFLGTLIPMIGLVQVGSQATADRYSYIPLIGLALAAAGAASEICRRRGRWPATLVLSSLAATIALTAVTTMQLRHWKNSEALFARSIAVTPHNFFAMNNLGMVYATQQRWEEAVVLYRRALDIAPDEGYPRVNLGVALEALGRPLEAVPEYEAALGTLTAPEERAHVHHSLARVLFQLGRTAEALPHLEQSRDGHFLDGALHR